jgi:hypothetical protein
VGTKSICKWYDAYQDGDHSHHVFNSICSPGALTMPPRYYLFLEVCFIFWTSYSNQFPVQNVWSRKPVHCLQEFVSLNLVFTNDTDNPGRKDTNQEYLPVFDFYFFSKLPLSTLILQLPIWCLVWSCKSYTLTEFWWMATPWAWSSSNEGWQVVTLDSLPSSSLNLNENLCSSSIHLLRPSYSDMI